MRPWKSNTTAKAESQGLKRVFLLVCLCIEELPIVYKLEVLQQFDYFPVSLPGTQIVGPLRGSVRGFVGYVETTVENFDLLIDLEKIRSMSPPPGSFHKV